MAPTAPPPTTSGGESRTIQVMALVIAVLCGLVAALTALIVSRHLGASALQSLAYAGGSFLAGTAFASAVQEKLGLF